MPTMRVPSCRILVCLPVLGLSACGILPERGSVDEAESAAVAAVVTPITVAPVATHRFEFDPDTDDVVGHLQITRSGADDTLSDIARRFNLGYEEIVRANPGIDPWLPAEGSEIVLPTQFVLPDAPRRGIVINLAAMRLYYFPERQAGEPQIVHTHPIGIGRVGWSTPEGSTRITAKARDPVWFPPASVRQEHAANGDPLPARVLAGPENPLGAHVFTLGWKSYLIHGTNKPYGVGMRVSHGCIRLYPEDIAALFEDLPIGTEVRVVNQPLLYGWHGDSLYVQVHALLEEDGRTHEEHTSALLNAAIADGMWQKVKQHAARLDLELVNALVLHPRGIATPVSRRGTMLEDPLAGARRVENRLPEGSNWNGKVELRLSAAELEAILDQ